MKYSKFIILFIIFYSNNIFGQNKYLLDFENLKIVDTIYDKTIIKENRLKSKIRPADFFLVETQNEILLYKKQSEYYQVYKLPFINHSEFHLSDNKKYITTKIENHHGARNLLSDSYNFCIINPSKNSYLCLESYSNIERWKFIEKKTNGTTEIVQSEVQRESCQSKFILEKNILTVLKTCTENGKYTNDCEPCFPSGVYQITDNSLKKIKEYSEESKTLEPVLWVDKVYTGMTISNLKKAYPKANLNAIPNYKYGFDSDKLGYELIKNDEILLFFTVAENKIKSILIVSPSFKYKGISSKMSINQILKKYPNSELHIDLISDWEYIYLKNQKITLIFKTDRNNRIGIYEKDPFTNTAKRIKRKNAKVDIIKI